jgi:hypothetical protein
MVGITVMMRADRVTTQLIEIVIFLQSVSESRRSGAAGAAQPSGMKKYIREMIDDLRRPKENKDFVPPVPKDAAKESVKDLTPKPAPVDPRDLSNQVLSESHEEMVKQLDYQAFESERLQTDE